MSRIYEMNPCGCNHSFICFQHRFIGRKPLEICDTDLMAANDDRIYPCNKCGTMRTKDEGGTIFAVCDACWDKGHTVITYHYDKEYNK